MYAFVVGAVQLEVSGTSVPITHDKSDSETSFIKKAILVTCVVPLTWK